MKILPAPSGSERIDIATARVTEAVVQLSRGRVTENAIGLLDLAIERLKVSIREVDVRRVLSSEPPVRLSDLSGRRRRQHPEDRVIVPSHGALLLVTQILELGVDDLALLGSGASRAPALCWATAGLPGLGLPVHHFSELV